MEKNIFTMVFFDIEGNRTRSAVLSFFSDTDSAVENDRRVRAAVQDFLSTDTGRQVLHALDGKFTWEDALCHVSAEIWAKHELVPVKQNATHVFYSLNEALA